MIQTLPARDVFRTDPVRGLPEAARVDRKAGMIYGAKAMEIGPLSEGDSRPYKVDAVTLSQLVELANQRNAGTKMRFAHPNMSQDGMGRHLGRASNAQLIGAGDAAYVAVDIRLSESAKRSPSGDLHTHVLDLAEEMPEDFGLSIAPVLDHEAMGKITPDEKGLVPIRLKRLVAIDVVDEPAATRGGLFSLDSTDLADLPAQATWLLDNHFAGSPAEVIRQRFSDFLDQYLSQRGDGMTKTVLNTDQELSELKAENERLKAENEKLKADLAEEKPDEEDEEEETPEGEMSKKTARAELKRRSELSALCKLAKCDGDLPLFIDSGFSRAEAQEWLKSSGKLSQVNPPISEGGNDPAGKKPTAEERFSAEFDASEDVFRRQGVTREQYIRSRKIDEGIAE